MRRSRLLLKLLLICSSLIFFSACNEEALNSTLSNLTNNAPTLTGTPDTSIPVNSAYSFTPLAADADGDPLTFSIDNQPLWADFDTNSGTLSGTPGVNDAGIYDNIAISVSDGKKETSLLIFSILVYTPSPNNQVPTISGIPSSQINAGDVYSFTPEASDPDNDDLQFQVNNKPNWATFDSSTGNLSGTPQSSDVGIYDNIEIFVTDGSLSAYLMPFSIEVINLQSQTQSAEVMISYSADLSNAMPLSGTTLESTTVYLFFKEGTDWSTRGIRKIAFYCCKGGSDSHTVTLEDSNAPYSISADLSQFTPNTTHELYADVFFQDAPNSPESFYYNFVIAESTTPPPPTTNSVPTISGVPATSVMEGNQYSFTPTAEDADGDSLTFQITNRPNWATFNTNTGVLIGTPAIGDNGVYSNIQISVSDGTATAFLDTFSIEVIAESTTPPPPPVNTAPTISGSPATTVNAGEQYSFTPTASDTDGDNLAFQITNKPSWANFDNNSGALYGTPANSDSGTYSNIVITVSDGTTVTSLSAFNIVVAAQPTTFGSATLSWTPPTERTDGSALTNLAGYKIYYGTSAGSYTSQIDVNNPGLTTYVVDNLPGKNTYYFVITSYDSSGVESAYSQVGSKTIP